MREIVNTEQYFGKAKDLNNEDIHFEWRHMNRLIKMGWNGVKVTL